MSYNAIGSHNTLLQVGDGANPEVFTTVSEVGDWDPPAFMRSSFSTTAQDDTSGTYIPSNLMDTDEFDVKINYRPTDPTHNASTGLIAAVRNKTRKNYRCLYPDLSGTLFNAYVTAFKPSAPNNGVLSSTVTFRPTGDLTPF